MTKKITRLFCIVLALTLVCTFVAGCSMFQTNADRYREKTAFKVGEQTVTVGALEDFINTNMASYLNQGYDAQSVWDALMPQFIMNYVLVDMLKEDLPWPKVTQTHSAASDYPDSEFLKNENDMEFIMKTVKNSLYQSLDSLVETELNNKYELNAAEEEEERKENVIPEDELNLPLGGLTLNDYDDDIEGLDEDLAKYRADDELTVDSILNGYKFEDENDPLLLDALAKVNDRIARNEDASDDEKVAFTAKEYMTAQKAAFNSLTRSVEQNYYGWSLAQFIDYQIKSTVFNRLAQEYTMVYYEGIETEGEGQQLILSKLVEKYENLKAAQEEDFRLHPTKFETFVTSLSDTSFIYTVPAQYENEYAFVKNLLISFSDEQKAVLEHYGNVYVKNSETYLAKRDELATQIKATDFKSEKDEDGEYAKLENIFTISEGEVTFADSVLKTALEAVSKPQDFAALIDRYNEDPGAQGATYDYVVKVKEPDAAGTQDSWVAEFSAASRAAIAEGQGSYKIAVTDYGVHIVYFTDYVKAETFDFANDRYTQGTAAYRFFKTYYDAVKATVYNDIMQSRYDSYFDQNKISVENKNIKNLLKQLGVELKWQL